MELRKHVLKIGEEEGLSIRKLAKRLGVTYKKSVKSPQSMQRKTLRLLQKKLGNTKKRSIPSETRFGI